MTHYKTIGLFRRTVSAIPSLKKLISVRDVDAEPMPFGMEVGQLCPDVIFWILEDQTGARYWAKKWLNEREQLLEPTLRIEKFLATLGRSDLTLAVDQHPQFGLIYRFDESLFLSKAIVHHWDCRRYFDAGECHLIEELAKSFVRWSELPEQPLGRLTDFQITRCFGRLNFLDFEPNRFYATELAGVAIP